jgi:hypothetical protein
MFRAESSSRREESSAGAQFLRRTYRGTQMKAALEPYVDRNNCNRRRLCDYAVDNFSAPANTVPVS